MPAESDLIPLFPLRSVLFPGGRLPLQIFEQRYIDLVSHCMKTDTGFGVSLITKGDEVVKPGAQQQVSRVGVYARIVDWDQLPNGLLGITVEGERKFSVTDCWARDDKLLMASVQWCAQDFVGQDVLPLTQEQEGLVDLLRDLMAHPLIESLGLEMDYTDQRQLGWRLSELLPVPAHQKQKLLELDDTSERLQEIENLVVSVMRHNN
ncbi:MAG: LON peptidase substrate-binding domain-containing protein [Pseudohongiella sp.]|nr:LON peptidase substrate-binding domain-containing protein [Pseudohongiella sp.]MDO9520401.1 LON peptidase substrate-binding domain-containing protein [Pseudohongiella sp.]MDP2126590.1 LON peptidase substrate-binding domain-containing protein [Pseudohongiella sp.]